MKRRRIDHELLPPECQAHMRQFDAWVDTTAAPATAVWCSTGFLLDSEHVLDQPLWVALLLATLLVGLGQFWGTYRWARDHPLPPSWPGRP